MNRAGGWMDRWVGVLACGESVVGLHLKTQYGWCNGGNGTNLAGFSGLPSGFRYENGNFSGGCNFKAWSSTEAPAPYTYGARAGGMDYNVDFTSLSGWYDKRMGFSVRCIQDTE